MKIATLYSSWWWAINRIDLAQKMLEIYEKGGGFTLLIRRTFIVVRLHSSQDFFTFSKTFQHLCLCPTKLNTNCTGQVSFDEHLIDKREISDNVINKLYGISVYQRI